MGDEGDYGIGIEIGPSSHHNGIVGNLIADNGDGIMVYGWQNDILYNVISGNVAAALGGKSGVHIPGPILLRISSLTWDYMKSRLPIEDADELFAMPAFYPTQLDSEHLLSNFVANVANAWADQAGGCYAIGDGQALRDPHDCSPMIIVYVRGTPIRKQDD